MSKAPNQNLKAVLDYLDVSNIELARALDLDPSLVSRYLSGHRNLKAASAQMDAIVDFILSRTRRVKDMDWLKARFREAGLPTDISTVYRFKQNLIMWLASDGATLRRNLGGTLPGDIAGREPPAAPSAPACLERPDAEDSVLIGAANIVRVLEPVLEALPENAMVDVFLSSDQLVTAVDEDVSALLLGMIARKNLHFRMVVCVSGNTQAMSTVLNTYMSALVSGHVRLSVVHGLTQAVTNAMHFILPNHYALLITETTGSSAPPIATVVRNVDFISEMEKSFDLAARYAQPILNIYGDNFSRNILEILYMEFCTPGALDVVKDSINPLYMPAEAYDRFLRTRGHNAEEYAWRSAEFRRFKAGMDEVLRGGSVYREILSLARLNDIALRGRCRLPGLYFMERGYLDLDAEGCAAILRGYVDSLQNVPGFQLLILDDLAVLHRNNCWHLKQNHSLGINYWSGAEPVMIQSDQLMLLREFQTHFDKLWARGAGGIGTRASVINVLLDVLSRLETRDDAAGAKGKPS